MMRRAWERVWPWLDAVLTRRRILLLGWLALIVFAYPGYMTWDSVQQLVEARRPPLTDWHPPMMALLWRFTDAIMSGPFPMLVIQTSVLLVGLDAILRRVLSPRRAAVVAVAIFLFPPVMVVMAVIWKDSLMAAFLVAGTAALLSSGRRWRVFGCLLLCFATTLRYNAPAATLPIVVLLFQWRAGLAGLKRYALAAGVWLAITVVAFGASRLVTDEPSHAWHRSIAIYDIAGTITFAPPMTDDQVREELGAFRALPESELQVKIRSAYSVNWWGPLLLGDERVFVEPRTAEERDAVSSAWWTMVTTHPWAYFKHRRKVFYRTLGLTAKHTGAVWTGFHSDLESDMLKHRVRDSKVQRAIADVLRIFEDSVLFRAWAYLAVTLLLLPLCRRARLAAAMLASGACYEMSLLLIAPSVDYRYSHWLFVTTVLGAILAFVARRRPTVKAVTRPEN